MAAVTTTTNGGDIAAIEMMAFLAELGARPRGAVFKGRRRENSLVTNAQIVQWQADAKISRDITPTTDDSDDSSKLFTKRIENRLRVLSKPRGARRIKSGKLKGKIRSKQKVVDSAAASALRAAANLVKNRMEERVNTQKDNSGGRLKPPTNKAYANQRENEFDVPPSEALEASGQLLNNLAAGGITILKGQTLMDRIGSDLGDFASQASGAALAGLKGSVGL